MRNRKGFSLAGIIAGFLLVTLTLVGITLADAVKKGDQVYLACNIWYEKPHDISSTLYQKGSMLPVGTRVTIRRKTRSRVKFRTEDGRSFSIEWVPKHRPGITFDQFCDRLFTDNTLDQLLEGLSEREIRAIRAGVVNAGMSKRAVLLSVGYPPENRTRSIELDAWWYWTSRRGNYIVVFKDDRVVQVVR